MTSRDVIVVTGAGGFLGSRVVPLIRRQAAQARVVAVTRRRRARTRDERGIERVHGDLRQAAVWRRLPRGVTHVIHLAAAIPYGLSVPNQGHVILDNVAPIAQLLHASLQWADLRHVVYASSVSVYAPGRTPLRESSAAAPASLYGAAKLAGEQLLAPLAARGVSVAALRYSSIYGSGQYPETVLPLLMDRARRGLPLHVFNGRRTQDFLHVDDAARAAWLACRLAARGAFNIGSGRAVSMSLLAREIVRAFGRSTTSRIVEEAQAAADDPGIRMTVRGARQRLGFRPRIGLRAGLRRLASEAVR
jgi:nucleoside-diphosphate-sugar epimerase